MLGQISWSSLQIHLYALFKVYTSYLVCFMFFSTKEQNKSIIYLVCVCRHEWYLVKPHNSFLLRRYLKPWGSIGSFSNHLLLYLYPFRFAGNPAQCNFLRVSIIKVPLLIPTLYWENILTLSRLKPDFATHQSLLVKLSRVRFQLTSHT